MMFKDRRDAGLKLAGALERFKSANPVVRLYHAVASRSDLRSLHISGRR